jgi:hypothetical protein
MGSINNILEDIGEWPQDDVCRQETAGDLNATGVALLVKTFFMTSEEGPETAAYF